MIHRAISQHHASAVVAALLILSCSAPPPVAETPQKPPNFIIIMADDLGYGDLSTYGGWIDVPSIDRLAAEGLKFTDFHSNGAVCSPTRAALLTGRYQQRAGIPMVVFADPKRETHRDGLQPIEYTFAEMLKDQGYATGIVGKWHLGYYPNDNPIHSGFDLFRGYVSGNVDFFSHVDGAGTFDWWHQDEKSDERGYVTTLINQHAVQFIEDNKDRPFCLYIPHEAPHSPYQGPGDDPAGFRVAGGSSARLELSPELTKQKYTEMVVGMDRGVGAVMDAVDRTGISDHTLIFFFSDNGATPRGSNGSLRGHKASVREGGAPRAGHCPLAREDSSRNHDRRTCRRLRPLGDHGRACGRAVARRAAARRRELGSLAAGRKTPRQDTYVLGIPRCCRDARRTVEIHRWRKRLPRAGIVQPGRRFG